MDDQWLKNVLHLLPSELKSHHKSILNLLSSEMKEDYHMSVKKAIGMIVVFECFEYF